MTKYYLDETHAKAYVDGSYNSERKLAGYGLVILIGDKVIELRRTLKNKKHLPIKNIYGELSGAAEALKYAERNKLEQIVIYYDYQGVEKWATGEWRTKRPFTIYYKDLYDRVSSKLKVFFVDVKAHSGNKYNERADELARRASKTTKNNNQTEV